MLQNYVSDHATWVMYHLEDFKSAILFHLKIQNANTSGLQALLNTGFEGLYAIATRRSPNHRSANC